MITTTAGGLPETDQPDLSPSRKARLIAVLRGLLLYVLVPSLILYLIARPAGDAVRASGTAVFWLLLAALGAVVLNWFVYAAIRQKRPSLLVFSHGVLCVLAVLVIGFEAVPSEDTLRSTLAVIGGYLIMISLYMFSLWCAAPHRNKLAHSTAVVLWVILFLFLCAMIYQIWRDIEVGLVTVDTWITIGSFVAFVLILFVPKMLSDHRRKAAFSKLTGQAEGMIVQIVGETRLDLDDDQVTRYHARVQYAVDNNEYETRADIARITVRRFGRDAFVGKTMPVLYEPGNPEHAFAKKIDRHFFDQQPPEIEGGSFTD